MKFFPVLRTFRNRVASVEDPTTLHSGSKYSSTCGFLHGLMSWWERVMNFEISTSQTWMCANHQDVTKCSFCVVWVRCKIRDSSQPQPLKLEGLGSLADHKQRNKASDFLHLSRESGFCGYHRTFLMPSLSVFFLVTFLLCYFSSQLFKFQNGG